ncbi:MAG: hypothetical protein ACE5DM_00870 [Candidatus Nanoarchaeia archaeon]
MKDLCVTINGEKAARAEALLKERDINPIGYDDAMGILRNVP